MSVTTLVRAMTSIQTSTISRLIQYAYFERFPILIAALLVSFPFGASHFAPTMLSGMLTLESQKQVFVTAWLAFQTAWTAMLCWRIILINGYQRFSIKPLQLRPSSSNTPVLRRWFTYFLFWPLFALPILYEVIKNSPSQRPILMTFFGFLGAWALMYVGSLTENWLFSTPAPDETPPREFRALAVPFNDGLQERARKSPSWLHDRVAGVLQSFPAKISDGYVEGGHLLPGHGLAFGVFVVLSLLYACGYHLLKPPRNSDFPTLAFVLMLVMIICWVLSGLSFLFDRYRVSVVLSMIVVGMLLHLLTNPEHYYDVSPSTTTAKPSSESAFQKWTTKHRSDKVVIVAASGGGIQAAAWTATVLTGLEHTCPGKFANSIGLISSVSGGSLGTMYFGSNYGSEGYRELRDPVIAAEKSSLAAAAWGIVYPDLLRTIAPGLVHDKTHDRGWAIEQAWKNHWGSPLETLDDWRLKASAGEMPAIIFNATTSDTGEKFLISNVDLPEVRGSRMWGYPDYTINVSTAARLSATFPYVTPISRANVPFPAFHVADGGYYDNFGIDSAIAWLRSVLAAHPQTKVLIVQIRASAHPDTKETNTRSWSWLHQGFGPLGTLLTTRTSAQLARNDNELRLLLEAKGKENILPTTFEFPKPDPPLSWHLTASDITEIKNQWSRYTSQSSGGEVNKVVQFLGDCSSMQQNFKSAQ